MFDQVDAGCIEAARRSEPGAVDRLVERCRDDAFRVALGILGNRGLAEDAAQESCAALIRSISSLRDTTAFSAWFYRLIVNASRALYRRERRHMDAQDIAWRDLPAPEERNAETIALHTALDRLSAAQRHRGPDWGYSARPPNQVAQNRQPQSGDAFHARLISRIRQDSTERASERDPLICSPLCSTRSDAMKRPSAFLLAAATLVAMALPSAAGPNKELQSMKGRVAYQPPNGAVRQIAVKASIVLADRDMAITGPNSLAALNLPDTSRVILGSNTRVQLAFFNQTNMANAKFIIYQGKTRFTVEHPKGARANYTFQTPTAQIAVRGTVGDILVNANRLQLNVYSLGNPTMPVRVLLSNGKVFFVHAGQAFVASGAGAAAAVQVLNLTKSLTNPFTELNAANNAGKVASLMHAALTHPFVAIPAAAVAGAVLVTVIKSSPGPSGTPTPVPAGVVLQGLPTPPPPMPTPPSAPTPHAPGPPPPPGAVGPHPPAPPAPPE